MSPRPSAAKARETRRRRMTLLWTAVGAIIVISLLYWEQTALLYVLATVSVTILLVVVAMADLHGTERAMTAVTEGGDSAALGSGIEGVPPALAAPIRRAPRRKSSTRRRSRN